MRSPIGTPSAVAIADSVSIVGLPRPPSKADNVALATPEARARSDRVRPSWARRRRRLAPTTLTISFDIANMETNAPNDLPAGRSPRLAAGRGRGRVRPDLRRARTAGRLRRPGDDRLLGHDVRRLGPVRRRVDHRRRRD